MNPDTLHFHCGTLRNGRPLRVRSPRTRQIVRTPITVRLFPHGHRHRLVPEGTPILPPL